MDLHVTVSEKDYLFTVSGRLDTATAPALEGKLKKCFDDAQTITFDFASLAYISSAGLRVLLASQKKMNAAGGRMTIRNVSSDIREIFDITGMSNIFTVV